MSNYEIEGTLLDSFNLGVASDDTLIHKESIAEVIKEELEERLAVCSKIKTNYVVYVLIMELEGAQDAISQRESCEDEEGHIGKYQARA